MCGCGNNSWLISDLGIRCTSCKIQKGDIVINQENTQTEVIQAMGIPPTLPNALELARAKLDRLQKKEHILDKIRDLIDSE